MTVTSVLSFQVLHKRKHQSSLCQKQIRSGLQARCHTTRLVTAAAVRNCEPHLPRVFANLNALRTVFPLLQCVFVFDNCSDASPVLLEKYRAQHPASVTVIHLEANTSPLRTVRIANARNAVLDFVETRLPETQFHLFFDADDKGSSRWDTSVLQKYLCGERAGCWDSVSFNRDDYYDAWALAYGDVRHHYLGFSNSLAEQTVCKFLNRFNQVLDASKEPEVEVLSAFNGMALYATPKLKGLRYDGTGETAWNCFSNEDRQRTLDWLLKEHGVRAQCVLTGECCEHVSYHMAAQGRGLRILVSKDHVTDHTR
eukprot:CAMPEP_0175113126 /NCGR_PEP_ID=MMETSP0086_2-20121207/15954_1 /TAXON_ID=136419 /ORGANISM="Unknown Unknown, Strain D1" /LENGTH=311 /DNA_ID=CAMNT_0016392283 /DNA_START=58 /DNA_END=993 /DNA_ORIENTATION=+